MLRLLTAASCLVVASMAVPWGARMTNPANQMMNSPFRAGGMMGAMASFLMPDGTALQFAGKNLEQICYEAYVKTRGTDGLSDAMRTATQFMVSSPGAVGAGANRQWQCLFNFATGNGRTAGGAPNVIGDYFDTAMETPGIINPCHNPYCGEGNMTPFEMLRRMMVPGGMMPNTGSMLGGFGTMPKPVGGNPLNAVGASGTAGGLPNMDAIFQAFGGANQAASQPAPTSSFINALASAAQLPLTPSNTPAGGNTSAPAVPAADAAAAGSSGAAKSPFTPQSLAQLAQIMAKMQTANQPQQQQPPNPLSMMSNMLPMMGMINSMLDPPDFYPMGYGMSGMGGMPGMGLPGMGGMPGMGAMPGMGGMPGMGTMPGMGGMPGMGAMPGMGGMPTFG